MLWHELKGVKLSSSAGCRIRSWEVSDTNSPTDRMPTHKPTELSRIKLKTFNSTARPYDEWAFSPIDFTANWLLHLALMVYMFVVNFDALAQASDFRIERRPSCLPLLDAGFKAGKSHIPICQQTECPPTNRLSYRASLETQQPVLWRTFQWLYGIDKCRWMGL